jgi:excisionase family DNA binding protein
MIPILTTSQAAAYLRVDTSLVRHWAREGRIGRRIGRDWCFTRGELERFNKGRRRRTTKEATP